MNRSFKKFAAISVIVTPILFIILTTIAMFLFPGGFKVSGIVFPSTYYRFDIHFFSDLGMLTTEAGRPNIPSAILWCIALTLVGLSFLMYALTLPSYFQKKTVQYRFAIVSSFIAVLSAIGFIGIAWTPWDIFLMPHIFFVFFAFPVAIGYSSLFCVSIFMKKTYPNIFGYLLILFSIAMGVYLWFLFGGPSVDGWEGRIIGALAQKAIVYIMIVLIPVQATGSLIAMKRNQSK
ncbi:MAG: hypothetical protein ACTSRE_11115 [Promethearchaeota archaeon]